MLVPHILLINLTGEKKSTYAQRSQRCRSIRTFRNQDGRTRTGRWKTRGAFHLVKISGISGSVVNGTRFVGSSHWKIPRKSGKSKKVVPFSRLEFPNGMSCSIYVSRSLYQFQVHGSVNSQIRCRTVLSLVSLSLIRCNSLSVVASSWLSCRRFKAMSLVGIYP